MPRPLHAQPADAPLILGEPTYGEVTDQIARIPLTRGSLWRWLCLFGFTGALVILLLTSIAWLLLRGVGIWGINIPVAWGLAIVNFVWWIGIGHAGTLISAILLLLRQNWRTSINRFAEAMTLFAVANAGLFPLLHLGRIWRFYYLFPYPSTLDVWPQWRSPLVWDVTAIITYGLVSLMFWYLGLVPDLATMRDTARTRAKRIAYGLFALGWRGSARHWRDHQMAYLLLAGLATPLVVSVHSIVSLDFSISVVPGWHSTIFPPYFVAGAIFSGFAMVLTIAIPLRAIYGLHNLITERHLDLMAKVMLVSGLIVAYGYVMEIFIAMFSNERFEQFLQLNRMFGPYAIVFWLVIACNVIFPQALWFRVVRRSAAMLFVLSIVINLGMWLERYMIVITSLHRDYLPSAWGFYSATFWDWSLFVGSLGFFAFLMAAFIRLVPSISVSEVRELIWEKKPAETTQGEAGASGARSEDETGSALEPYAAPPPLDPDRQHLYGLAAEFDRPDALREAAARCREAGYERVEAYTPFPVHGMDAALGMKRSRLPLIALLGAVLGGSGAYLLQWWTATVDYPWNIGGRPLHSWPSFIPVTFELTVLSASACIFAGLFVLHRLPALYHPIFNARNFGRASRDRFFLCIEANDDRFDPDEVRRILHRLGARAVSEVPW